MFEIDVLCARASLPGCPVFVEAGGYFTGLMISSNVPYKLASDKAFFENWVPVDTVESAAAARLPLGQLAFRADAYLQRAPFTRSVLWPGFQPIRPSNVVSTLVSVALKRLPKLMRSRPRASWLPTPHAGTVWLKSVLAPYDASDTRLAAVAEQCHRATRR